jgi:hypothetical protein
MSFSIAVCSLILATMAGCATVVPPASPANPAPIYLTNYGKHASVILPDPAGHWTEFAYGDFGWFALNHTTPLDAVRAMFVSSPPTTGRRQLASADDTDSMRKATRALKVTRIVVSHDKAERLLVALDNEYFNHLDPVTYNVLTGLWYVQGGKHYSAFHNCNHVAAYWLKQCGCSIKGPVMFSYFKVAPAQSPPAR